jgi:hypothetical protein
MRPSSEIEGTVLSQKGAMANVSDCDADSVLATAINAYPRVGGCGQSSRIHSLDNKLDATNALSARPSIQAHSLKEIAQAAVNGKEAFHKM